jgi:hypothetical protein
VSSASVSAGTAGGQEQMQASTALLAGKGIGRHRCRQVQVTAGIWTYGDGEDLSKRVVANSDVGYNNSDNDSIGTGVSMHRVSAGTGCRKAHVSAGTVISRHRCRHVHVVGRHMCRKAHVSACTGCWQEQVS